MLTQLTSPTWVSASVWPRKVLWLPLIQTAQSLLPSSTVALSVDIPQNSFLTGNKLSVVLPPSYPHTLFPELSIVPLPRNTWVPHSYLPKLSLLVGGMLAWSSACPPETHDPLAGPLGPYLSTCLWHSVCSRSQVQPMGIPPRHLSLSPPKLPLGPKHVHNFRLPLMTSRCEFPRAHGKE